MALPESDASIVATFWGPQHLSVFGLHLLKRGSRQTKLCGAIMIRNPLNGRNKRSSGQQSQLRAPWKGRWMAESGHVPQNLQEQGAASRKDMAYATKNNEGNQQTVPSASESLNTPGLSSMFQVSWRWHCQILSSVWSYFRFHHSASVSLPTLHWSPYLQHCFFPITFSIVA